MWLFFCWTSSNQFQHKLVKKISYQVHLNQSETEKYFERIYDKDIYEKSYTTHVKTHSSLTLSVVLVSAAQFCFQALAIALDLFLKNTFPFFTHKYLSYNYYLHFCHLDLPLF